MTNIQKSNKALIGVIAFAVIAYVVNIINLSLFASDFTQITAQIQMISGFIPDQDVQTMDSILSFANNAALVVRMLLVTIAAISALASLIGLGLLKFFASRAAKYNSFFSYCGVIIAASANLYIQYSLHPTFDGIISLILIGATALIVGVSVFMLVAGVHGLYKVVMADDFKAGQIGLEVARVLSLIIVFYIAAIVAIKVTMYVAVSIFVQSIDLASMIDIMNYINVDWEAIIPVAVMSTGIISADKIDLLLNNLADQYVLNYASTFIQDLILNVSSSIIFKGIVTYIATFIAGLGVLFTAKTDFEFRNFAALGLVTLTTVLSVIYVGGILVNILAIGYVVCIILIGLEIYKQYRG
ncbi:hypothetical protein RZE82_02255 [Mollicutes bacterium LVI A0039]|nr:hypothetical protein RZE82_02255 [Mollicutes bacterium LVI A0039]